MTCINTLNPREKGLKIPSPNIFIWTILGVILVGCSKGVGGPSSRGNIIINDGLPSGAKGFPKGADDTPVETPVETLVETLVETPVETLVETLVETPVETLVETPVETLVETPVETSAETLVETLDDAEDDINDPDDGGLPPDDRSLLSLSILYIQPSSQEKESLLLPSPPTKTLKQQQLETIKGVEKVVFNMIATMTLNDVPGPHQDNMEAIALVLRTHTIKNPYFVDIVAREGGDDIIASPNNSFFSILDAIDRISDPSTKERAISGLKDDVIGDIILVSAGNTGKELVEHSVLKEPWVKELLEEEGVNVFFVIGIITNKDGETSIDDISSTLPISLADHVIGASTSFPILVEGNVLIPGGTSTSAVLAGTFFARLQVLLPEASIKELVEIGKWLLEPLENSNSLGILSFEKFTQIKEYYCQPLGSISLNKILTYIQSNPKEDPTLNEEGLSGAQELFSEPTVDGVTYVPDDTPDYTPFIDFL